MALRKIETHRLVVRPISENDVQSFYRLSQEWSLGQWMPDQVYKDEAEAAGVIQFLMSQYQQPLAPQERPIVVAVELKAMGELIGHVGLSPLRSGIEIGYAIGEHHCGKGYATEAVLAVVKWALSELDVREIVGIVACENVGSFRVLEKSGFSLEDESEANYLGKMRMCRRYLVKRASFAHPLVNRDDTSPGAGRF